MGAQATAVDIFTSALIYLKHPVDSVTSDLHISCISAAPLGSTVICVCKILRAGTGLQFASCEIYREIPLVAENWRHEEKRKEERAAENNNEMKLILIFKGLHTKYVLKKGRKKGFDGGATKNNKVPTF